MEKKMDFILSVFKPKPKPIQIPIQTYNYEDTFGSIPDEVLMEILTKLPEKQLIAVERTCKHWGAVAKINILKDNHPISPIAFEKINIKLIEDSKNLNRPVPCATEEFPGKKMESYSSFFYTVLRNTKTGEFCLRRHQDIKFSRSKTVPVSILKTVPEDCKYIAIIVGRHGTQCSIWGFDSISIITAISLICISSTITQTERNALTANLGVLNQALEKSNKLRK